MAIYVHSCEVLVDANGHEAPSEYSTSRSALRRNADTRKPNIYPKALFACELWNSVSASDMAKLESTHHMCLKQSPESPSPDQIRHGDRAPRVHQYSGTHRYTETPAFYNRCVSLDRMNEQISCSILHFSSSKRHALTT